MKKVEVKKSESESEKFKTAVDIFAWLMNLSDEETLYYAKHAKLSGHLKQDHIKYAFKKRWENKKNGK